MLLFKLFFFQLKCRIPDLIPRENAEALSSLHFQTPADILVSTLIPVMPLLSGDATGVYLNIQLESSSPGVPWWLCPLW